MWKIIFNNTGVFFSTEVNLTKKLVDFLNQRTVRSAFEKPNAA